MLFVDDVARHDNEIGFEVVRAIDHKVEVRPFDLAGEMQIGEVGNGQPFQERIEPRDPNCCASRQATSSSNRSFPASLRSAASTWS